MTDLSNEDTQPIPVVGPTRVPPAPPMRVPVDATTRIPVGPPTNVPAGPTMRIPVDPPTNVPAGPTMRIPVDPPTSVPPAAPARRPRRLRWLIGVPAVVAVAVAAVVAAEWNPLYTYLRHGRLTIAAPPAPPALKQQVAPVPGTAPTPTAGGIAAALGPLAANPALGTFAGVVTDAATGVTLWNVDSARPMVPASSTKVLTAAAALLSLPPDHRVTTAVVRGAAPNQLVLIGGGDVTLTAQPVGAPSIYPGSPHLDDLVAQLRRAGVTAVTSILVDTSAWTGPNVAPGWATADIAGGDFSPMEPVMIDGGRLKPMDQDSPRTPTAALDAGKALAAKLGADPAVVSMGVAPPGAAPLASVQSAPLSTRLREALLNSDNVLAESIAREVAKNAGAPATFDGGVQTDENVLRQAGIDLGGVTLNDGNGLSTNDRIPPRVLDAILAAAAGPNQPRLRPLLDSLPVAGATGTLTDRYQTVNHAGAGWVRAKTGTLSIANALAGYIVDSGGRVLTFALMSNGETGSDTARPALDSVATALRSCGCQ